MGNDVRSTIKRGDLPESSPCDHAFRTQRLCRQNKRRVASAFGARVPGHVMLFCIVLRTDGAQSMFLRRASSFTHDCLRSSAFKCDVAVSTRRRGFALVRLCVSFHTCLPLYTCLLFQDSCVRVTFRVCTSVRCFVLGQSRVWLQSISSFAPQDVLTEFGGEGGRGTELEARRGGGEETRFGLVGLPRISVTRSSCSATQQEADSASGWKSATVLMRLGLSNQGANFTCGPGARVLT